MTPQANGPSPDRTRTTAEQALRVAPSRKEANAWANSGGFTSLVRTGRGFLEMYAALDAQNVVLDQLREAIWMDGYPVGEHDDECLFCRETGWGHSEDCVWLAERQRRGGL